MALLLAAHHGDVSSRTRDALTLSIPDDWFGISGCDLLSSGGLTTEDVWPLDSKATQVGCDVVSTSITLISLALLKLLLCLLAFCIHDAYFEMLAPFGLEDVLLAIGTFLVSFRWFLRLFLLIDCFAHIVFDDLHVWVESSRTATTLDHLSRRSVCRLFSCLRHCNSLRIWHALKLRILRHVLLHLLLDQCR